MIFMHTFNDKKEIEYIRFSFEVKNSQSIQINIMDGCFEHAPIIVRDSHGNIRGLYTLKTRIKTHFIGQSLETTSNGGIAGKLSDGEWSIEVIKPSYRVAGRIQLEVRQDRELKQLNVEQLFSVLEEKSRKITENQAGWVSAELHCHSYYSDGRVNFEDILAEINRQELDVIAIMDHSVVATQFIKSSKLIIPGTEITLDNEVHYNVYGLNELVDYSKYFSEEKNKNQSLDLMFTDLKEKEFLLSINHPFAEGMSLGHDFDVRNFNFIEVINAPYVVDEFIDNKKAIKFFDFLWSEGHCVFGLGGSDAHKKNYKERYPMGIPKNNIYLDEYSVDGALNSMKRGHLFLEVENSCEIQIFNGENECVLPGTEYQGDVFIDGKSETPITWKIIDNGVCIDSMIGKSCSFKINVKPGHMVRLEGTKDNQPVLFVNPIYCKCDKISQIDSFVELIHKFNQSYREE